MPLGMPELIIFELLGHAVDTRLLVFDTERHVHFLILKTAQGTYPRQRVLARLSNSYMAGPAVSISLDAALARSPRILEHLPHLPHHPEEYLKTAYRLRNKLPHKESMVHAASQWKFLKRKRSLARYSELRGHATTANASLGERVEIASYEMAMLSRTLKTTSYRGDYDAIEGTGKIAQALVIVDRMQQHALSWLCGSYPQPNSLAKYYRALYEDKFKITSNHTNHPDPNNSLQKDCSLKQLQLFSRSWVPCPKTT